MSSGKNPPSSSECKSYTKDTCIRQHHSQPIKKDSELLFVFESVFE